MNVVFFNANREGYSPEQCTGSLTVGELIDILYQYDRNNVILTRHDEGYTFGSITRDDIFSNE